MFDSTHIKHGKQHMDIFWNTIIINKIAAKIIEHSKAELVSLTAKIKTMHELLHNIFVWQQSKNTNIFDRIILNKIAAKIIERSKAELVSLIANKNNAWNVANYTYIKHGNRDMDIF